MQEIELGDMVTVMVIDQVDNQYNTRIERGIKHGLVVDLDRSAAGTMALTMFSDGKSKWYNTAIEQAGIFVYVKKGLLTIDTEEFVSYA